MRFRARLEAAAVTFLLKFLSELKISIACSSTPRRVVLEETAARVGTHWLMSMLEQHPRVASGGEYQPVVLTAAGLQKRFDQLRADADLHLLKLGGNSMLRLLATGTLSNLTRSAGVCQTIYLTRDEPLDVYASEYRATHGQGWHACNQASASQEAHWQAACANAAKGATAHEDVLGDRGVDPASVLKATRAYYAARAAHLAALRASDLHEQEERRHSSVHVVHYEELQHDAAGGMQRLFHALSLSPLKVNADGQFAKMPSRPLWQAVPRENWAAVCRAFGRANVTTPAIERECRRSPSRRRRR